MSNRDDQANDHLDWVDIREAAIRLAKSEKTIRRMIKAGKLTTQQVDTPQGYTWMIGLERAEPAPVQEHEPLSDERSLLKLDNRLASVSNTFEICLADVQANVHADVQALQGSVAQGFEAMVGAVQGLREVEVEQARAMQGVAATMERTLAELQAVNDELRGLREERRREQETPPESRLRTWWRRIFGGRP